MTDNWTIDGNIFILDGLKYSVAPSGKTICLGVATEKVSDGVRNLPGGQGVILQHPIKGNVLDDNSQVVVMQQKHAGGRPRKQGAVHRITTWRRQKELQGELC